MTGNGWYLGGARHGQLARPYPDPRPAPDLASIIGDEWSVFIMSVFRRRVYTTIGPFDEAMRSNEDYDFWLRAAVAGFTLRPQRPAARPLPRSAPTACRRATCACCAASCTSTRKLRPAIAERPREMAILERQISRFEAELLAAEARLALEIADFEAAREHLGALHARRGGAALRRRAVPGPLGARAR